MNPDNKLMRRISKKYPELVGHVAYQPFHFYLHRISCAYCLRALLPPGHDSDLTATRDHPRPRSKGGRGFKVWCCITCNQLKADRHYEDWRMWMDEHPNWWEVDYRELRDANTKHTQEKLSKGHGPKEVA